MSYLKGSVQQQHQKGGEMTVELRERLADSLLERKGFDAFDQMSAIYVSGMKTICPAMDSALILVELFLPR